MEQFSPTLHWYHYALSALSICVSVGATVHVLLSKRDTRSSIGWIGLIWLSPMIGTTMYVLLGINRIERKARALRRDRPEIHKLDPRESSDGQLCEVLGADRDHLACLARLGEAASGRRLLEGNRIEPLDNGDEAYPAMIRAIDGAEHSITLLTYIFRNDRAGVPVAEALARASDRGVEVRVLIDAVGSFHEGSPIVHHLRAFGLRVSKFIPTLRPKWFRYANLRNHRKIMVVDGRLGFTGGMNILDDFLADGSAEPPCRDVHFEVRGPVVATLQQVFADDWAFSTGEILEGKAWFPLDPDPEGRTLARVIVDGPDLDDDPLAAVYFGAMAVARDSISIITPYFIPGDALTAALTSAALRGVAVDIVVPEQNNHRLVQWAGFPLLEPLLEAGCRVWMSPPPFEHTKLMTVDDAWTFLGSSNLDPRSLVLNFEMNLECYDPALAVKIRRFADRRRDAGRRVTLEEIRGRPIPLRLRDNLARLFSPYL